MRVLVTGAAGYIGRAVTRALIEAGHQVRALVHTTAPDALPAVDLLQGDILDPRSLDNAVREVDAVCHMAALVRVRESIENPLACYRINVSGTLNVLDALQRNISSSDEPPRLVFASTGAVYGAPILQPITEETSPAPLNPYGASKLAAEQAIAWQARTGRLAAVTLRIFNAVGSADGRGDPDLTRIIPGAVAVAAGKRAHLDINGDGSAVRDFVHVLDIAAAFLAALDVATPGEHRIYNVGATPASVNDIVVAVEHLSGRSMPIQRHPSIGAEAPRLVADTKRLRSHGWQPTHSSLDRLVSDQWSAATDR